MSGHTNAYTRTSPFLASIKERYNLCGTDAYKATFHVVLDIRGSGIQYAVGDSIGVFSTNDSYLVDQTLQVMGATGDEEVVDRHGEHRSSLRHFLTTRANLNEISRKLFNEISYRQAQPTKKSFLEAMLKPENKEELKEYLTSHHLWDILLAHNEVQFVPQELCNLMMPLLPRFYSIASSQKVVGDEVHLTVALLHYLANGHPRKGVCTHFLCERTETSSRTVPVYIQPNHGFTLPVDPDAPIIMVGPGTGVAPFRAFMQERIQQGATGKNWLFFGERHHHSSFLYKDYWEQLVQDDKLRLDLAFSRDQDYKIYVQHRMLEHGAELYEWLENGAYFFVCGDANQMARDVEAALAEIIREHGHKSDQEASAYIKKLRTEKRYLRDVY